MMGGMIALLLLSIVPYQSPAVVSRTVDVVELNSFYDDNGRLVFDQNIFKDWSPSTVRHEIRAWRLVRLPSQVPVRTTEGLWMTVWSENDKTYMIYARSLERTWTQHDPELIEREFLPKEKRKEL